MHIGTLPDPDCDAEREAVITEFVSVRFTRGLESEQPEFACDSDSELNYVTDALCFNATM